MDKEKFLNSGLIEQFVLGITTPEEAAEVEKYAEQYPEIREEIEQLRTAVEDYARQYAIHPPDEVKTNILKEIDELDQPAASSSNNALARWLPMVAIIASLFLAYNQYQQKNQLAGQLKATQDEYNNLQATCKKDKAACLETQRLYASITNGNTNAVSLTGTALAPQANVIVYWNPVEKQALLNVLDLPKPPKGKQYQLWADVDGVMIDMGVFNQDETTLKPMAFIENPESFNITLEPEGGSEHPTVELLQAAGKTG